MKKLTLKDLFENWQNMDNKKDFEIAEEGNKTTISGKYNTLNSFCFQVSTSYFHKLEKQYL